MSLDDMREIDRKMLSRSLQLASRLQLDLKRLMDLSKHLAAGDRDTLDLLAAMENITGSIEIDAEAARADFMRLAAHRDIEDRTGAQSATVHDIDRVSAALTRRLRNRKRRDRRAAVATEPAAGPKP